MPVFLSDPPAAAYLGLVALDVVAGLAFARYQDRKRAVPFALALVLLGGLFLLDRLYTSPREDAVTAAQDMLDAVNRRDADRLLRRVSDSFAAGGLKKNDLRRAVELAGQHGVTVTAWNFDRNQVEYRDGPPPAVDIVFDAKAEGPAGVAPKHVRMTFARNPDGAYRLRTFATFNIVQKRVEEPIPGLPR